MALQRLADSLALLCHNQESFVQIPIWRPVIQTEMFHYFFVPLGKCCSHTSYSTRQLHLILFPTHKPLILSFFTQYYMSSAIKWTKKQKHCCFTL